MRTVIITFCILILSGTVVGQQLNVDKERQSEIIASMDESASAVKTLQCRFTQTKELPILNDKMVSHGVMYYSQDRGKLHWEYLSPYRYTFILNGNRIMMKSEAHTDVLEISDSRIFQEIARIMMNSLTGKCLTAASDFDTEIVSVDTTWIAELTPLRREMREFFSKIRLHFDPERRLVFKVEMIGENGDNTVIELNDIRTNITIDEKVFAID